MLFITKPSIDSDARLAKHFMKHQINWILAERAIHERHQKAIVLAEKSIRIGWTYADAFKNVRKRILFKGRDYLFATKDYPSALEYVRQCYRFAEIFDLTSSITRHGEESISVNRLDEHGRPSAFTEDVKVGVIKFDNGSRIIAFSANPQAMAVYGGDVGLDEFAKHPNARLLWETAQGRITWGGDLAVWSSHDGEDTLFNEFAQEARAACDAGHLVLVSPGHWQSKGSLSLKSKLKNLFSSHSTGVGGITPCAPPTDDASIQIQNSEFENGSNPCSSLSVRGSSPSGSSIDNRNSKFENPSSPWNLYFRVSMPDAIRLGLVERINNAT